MHSIHVGEELTVFTAQAMWAQWQPILEEKQQVCFDCSSLTEFDSCGAQLFYFIVSAYSKKQDTEIRFSNIPGDVREELETLNLQGIVSDGAPGEG